MAEGTELKRECGGGVAFEVIIKPASSDVAPPSPSKDRPAISQEDIDRKLKEAEERRVQLESQRLQAVLKEKDKVVEVNLKNKDIEEAFSKEVEKKLADKLVASEELKKAQEAAKLEKLKEHERHVQEVRKKKQAEKDNGGTADVKDTE
ncbi:hypothetical protein HELRODRAFT_192700 [Helobdella robusta]|uniref:Stathmin n=1 Tax=Helobdella robusta TaxID=6412 RepID=T1FU76_HELRO|nr:hypothetical protein HELRODRAFT_192700 [Helobdella robusta]ESO00020.1 hypothetical protein HELRODRAFT_192700 [Helobdella robusta]